jgi:hypothetical protein
MIFSVYYPVILGVYSVFICERVERSVEGIRKVFSSHLGRGST